MKCYNSCVLNFLFKEVVVITKEEVLKLGEAIPPRYPRGDPRNYARLAPAARFWKAVIKYEKEHGRSWFDDMQKEGE